MPAADRAQAYLRVAEGAALHKDLQTEGKAQEVKGKAQNTVGDVKNTVKSAVNKNL